LTLAETNDRLDALVTTIDSLSKRVTAGGSGRCSAKYPHPEGLTFMRGINQYMCQCGQIYAKDSTGGLRDV